MPARTRWRDVPGRRRWRRVIPALLALLLAAACGTAAPAPSASGGPGASVAPTPTPARSAAPSTAAPTATAGRSSPPPATATPPVPTPTPAPPPPPVSAGAPAYVAVAVATLWRSPQAPRAVDAPALASPVRIRDWLAGLDWDGRAGLIDRADSQMLLGDRVDVRAVSAGWAQVTVPDQATPLDAAGYPGWVPLRQLTAVPPPPATAVATVVAGTSVLRGPPDLEVTFGTRLPLLAREGDRVRVGLPGGASGTLEAAAVAVAAPGAAALAGTADAVLATARSFLGLPYLWAGTSGYGFDCSGLVYTVYRTHGVLLPRDAAPQALHGAAVALDALRPGDLLFFGDGEIHHVAIYAGSGMLLDSPSTGGTVEVVPLSGEPYRSELVAARRVLP